MLYKYKVLEQSFSVVYADYWVSIDAHPGLLKMFENSKHNPDPVNFYPIVCGHSFKVFEWVPYTDKDYVIMMIIDFLIKIRGIFQANPLKPIKSHIPEWKTVQSIKAWDSF